MQLTDIVPRTEWARLESQLHDRFNMNCTVYDTSGTGISGIPNWCNRLCPVIKANKDALAAICAPANQFFMAKAKRDEKAVIGECDAGLIKLAVPIFINGTFLGTAGGCGRLPTGGEVETFIVSKSTGLDENDIAALCRGIHTMSADQARQMVTFIEHRIARYLLSDSA